MAAGLFTQKIALSTLLATPMHLEAPAGFGEPAVWGWRKEGWEWGVWRALPTQELL